MATATLHHGGLQPRPPGGLWPGAGLSLLVHAGLVAAVALGVSWQRSTPVVYSAELWSALPEVAAPRAATPEPLPAPPSPRPAPQPAPVQPAETPARSAADIAVERERERERAAQREQAEREARLQRERETQAKRAKAAEDAALKRQRELQRQREEEIARKAEEERLEKQRQENLKRLLAQAGGRPEGVATGPAAGTGTAARNAAPSQQYGGILREHVRAQLKFDTTGLPPTLETVVEIRATASGTVLSRQLLRRSGNDAWDNAVLRAIDAASPLPRDRKGTTPGTIEITFRPVD